jgi:ABC-2 type transport system permease protein
MRSSSFVALLSKETKALFTSPIAYAVITVFALLMGYTFTATLFLHKTASLIHVFFQAALMMLLLVPVLTMRMFAEERCAGTLELILTSPCREIDVVMAKFPATMAVIAAMMLLSLSYPLTLEFFGEPEWGQVYSGYLGLLLFSGALTAIGLAVSALTTNQIVAPVASTGLSFLLWML